MTPQSMFMIVAPIIPEKRTVLESLLVSMNRSPGHANPSNSIVPFAQFGELHSARFLIIDANTGHEIKEFGWQPHDWTPALAFLGEVDGDCQLFLASLSVRASTGLALIYQCCAEFDSHSGSMLEWLQSHNVKSAARYVNWSGRTVRRVSENDALCRSLSQVLPQLLKIHGRDNPRQIRQDLLTHVQKEQHAGRLTLTPDSPTGWLHSLRHFIDFFTVPAIVLILSPLLLLIAPFVTWRLRFLENRDPDITDRPDSAHIASLSLIEDHDVCNQFNVYGDIKPGMFRYLLLKFIMWLVDYAARHVYKRGNLARVRTIHFARWVFLNNNRSMFFASLYDGSLESYMDDFINKVAFGLNLTFSHGVGYPRTRWLIKGGAEIEQQFKNTLRRHQLPSAVWYHAHSGLTALDMARQERIRHGVENYPRSDACIQQWLSEL